MKRREFIKGAGVVIGATLTPVAFAADDVPALKRIVADYYKIYCTDLDKKKYRSMLTDDYLLLENGEIISLEKDVSLMPAPQDGYERKDSFDFRSVKVHGDVAYLVYFLKSDINDKKEGARKREYLESIVMKQDGAGVWRVALLHSTKMTKA